MAYKEHLNILKQGVNNWNQWRKKNPDVIPILNNLDLGFFDYTNINLHGAKLMDADFNFAYLENADLSSASLIYADFTEAKLIGAKLKNADLCSADMAEANLTNADLKKANLYNANLACSELCGANLSHAYLVKADLQGANLNKANLSYANLYGADLSGTILEGTNLNSADLTNAILVETNLNKAELTNCRIYGISAWDIKLKDAIQKDLIITPKESSSITVDNLEVAQFIYLILNNEKIRDVIDTVTSKVVLILGRFTPKRKAILNAIKEELRKKNFVPVVFDFEKPLRRNFRETVTTLARMAKFIIADITQAKIILQELEAIVPKVRVPVKPILHSSAKSISTIEDFKDYPWFLETYRYRTIKSLLVSLNDKVITPAESKALELIK